MLAMSYLIYQVHMAGHKFMSAHSPTDTVRTQLLSVTVVSAAPGQGCVLALPCVAACPVGPRSSYATLYDSR
jgi:hypothetical protein